jgi:hypothetical protein
MVSITFNNQLFTGVFSILDTGIFFTCWCRGKEFLHSMKVRDLLLTCIRNHVKPMWDIKLVQNAKIKHSQVKRKKKKSDTRKKKRINNIRQKAYVQGKMM